LQDKKVGSKITLFNLRAISSSILIHAFHGMLEKECIEIKKEKPSLGYNLFFFHLINPFFSVYIHTLLINIIFESITIKCLANSSKLYKVIRIYFVIIQHYINNLFLL